jgi:hypothetical protein
MQKQEFENRIGLVITSEEYSVIEKAYMGLPESVNKDKFVKIWLREGGIQDLFDKRLWEIRKLNEANEKLLQENNEVWGRANDYVAEIQDWRKQVEALKEKLAAIAEVVA